MSKCIKCDSDKIHKEIVTSKCESYDDLKLMCFKCGYTWWIDGSDY